MTTMIFDEGLYILEIRITGNLNINCMRGEND